MGTFPSFDDFMEIKESKGEESKKGFGNLPPQGKGAKPYFAPHTKNKLNSKMRVVEKPTDALGDKATPSLSNPKHSMPLGSKPSYTNLTTEQFLKKTEKMSTSNFVESVIHEEKNHSHSDDVPAMTCQYTGKRVVPSAIEVAKYMATMLPQNENARRTFMRELKNNGSLGSLIGEMVNHNETYSELVNQMGMPEAKVARRFAKAMNENHVNFMTELGMMTDPTHMGMAPVKGAVDTVKSAIGMGESVDMPLDKRLGISDDDDEDSDDMGDDELNGSDDMGDDDNADGMGDDMSGDDTNGGEDDASMDGGDAMGDDPSSAEPSQQSPQMKLNKEFAYHHMVKEMAKYDNMASVMKEMFNQ